MIGSGVAQSHPFGGVHIEFGSQRIIRRNGQPNENLYALGQLAAGNLYYTSSLPMITKQIERIVPRLLACYADQARCAA